MKTDPLTRIIPIALLSFMLLAGCESEEEVIVSVVNSNQQTSADNNAENTNNNVPVIGRGTVVRVDNYTLNNTGAAASSELLTYRMPAVAGGITVSRAIVLLPAGQAPAGGWPIVAWGHQTTGVADNCAPSRSNDVAGKNNYLQRFLQNGYAVVATDFEGLGDTNNSELHPYLHLASGGRSILYAVSAAVSQYGSLSNRFAVVGHSQGGHAALGAAERASELSDINMVATVAMAPVSDLQQQSDSLNSQLRNDALDFEDRLLAAGKYILFGALISEGIAAAQPGFVQTDLFGANGGIVFNSLNSDCLQELAAKVAATIVLPLRVSGNVDSVMPSGNLRLPTVTRYLAENEPGLRGISVPVMLAQGLNDRTVLPESSARLYARLQGNNTSVTLVPYAGASHSDVVDYSAGDVLEFLNSNF